MFSFRKRDKTPKKADPVQPQAAQSLPGDNILGDDHVARVLELEEKVASENYGLKHIEELVQLYAVASCDR